MAFDGITVDPEGMGGVSCIRDLRGRRWRCGEHHNGCSGGDADVRLSDHRAEHLHAPGRPEHVDLDDPTGDDIANRPCQARPS